VRYLALVTDYDGVLATDGRMSPDAVVAIERLRTSGRRAIMVTGRRLDDILEMRIPEDSLSSVSGATASPGAASAQADRATA